MLVGLACLQHIHFLCSISNRNIVHTSVLFPLQPDIPMDDRRFCPVTEEYRKVYQKLIFRTTFNPDTIGMFQFSMSIELNHCRIAVEEVIARISRFIFSLSRRLFLNWENTEVYHT